MGLNPTILRQSGRRVPPQFNGSLIPRRRPYRASGLVLTSSPVDRSARGVRVAGRFGERVTSDALLPFPVGPSTDRPSLKHPANAPSDLTEAVPDAAKISYKPAVGIRHQRTTTFVSIASIAALCGGAQRFFDVLVAQLLSMTRERPANVRWLGWRERTFRS